MRNLQADAPARKRLWPTLLAALIALPWIAGLAGAAGPAAAAQASRGIPAGAGAFEAALPGGRTIDVFTYRAERHGPQDPIVIVLPGGGRNGDDYRDSWIEAAERFGLLVLSPSFDEARFPGFIEYNLAGMLRGVTSGHGLDGLAPTPPDTWLYPAIEAIFDEAVTRTGSAQVQYDLFGHSAGGQIVHRMILFAPELRVRTALAANSGWYTTVAPDLPFPYGLRGLPLPPGQIEKAFGRRLVLFLGELDNAQETRGHLRRSPETDAQGAHRLARGRHFHAVAREESERLGVPLNWDLHVVPGVGHAYREMGAAAADYLYGSGGPGRASATSPR